MSSSFRGDVGKLIRDRAFLGYVLCQVLASQIIFTFAGGGPYIVVTQMGRTTAEYGAWFATTGFAYLVGNLFCVRFAPRHSLEKLIWFGLALQFGGALLNLTFSIVGTNQAPLWLFGTQMIVMVANAFVMNNAAAGAISVRPEAAGTAAGAMGFLQQGIGALVSQFGAYLGGHSTTTLPLTAAIFALSIACASAMFFLVPRPNGRGQRGIDGEGGGGRERDVVRVKSDVSVSLSAVIRPRRRGIQYAAASRLVTSAVSGILDHPPSRVMTVLRAANEGRVLTPRSASATRLPSARPRQARAPWSASSPASSPATT